jgi:SAM-dependent methyltransferase
MNKSELVRIHHAEYLEDIPFWTSVTEGQDPVLEVGCGHGRVSLPLLESGRVVVGVDIELPAIQYLQEEIKKAGPAIQARAQIRHENILHHHAVHPYGAVIIPCNTLSTFSAGERQILLSRIYQQLKPGGVFAASVPNPSQVISWFEELRDEGDQSEPDPETSFIHPGSGFPVEVSSNLHARENSLGWSWIYDHLRPDGQVDRVIQSTEHYLSSLEEYRTDLVQAGFNIIQSLGDFESSAYSGSSPYLILISKK